MIDDQIRPLGQAGHGARRAAPRRAGARRRLRLRRHHRRAGPARRARRCAPPGSTSRRSCSSARASCAREQQVTARFEHADAQTHAFRRGQRRRALLPLRRDVLHRSDRRVRQPAPRPACPAAVSPSCAGSRWRRTRGCSFRSAPRCSTCRRRRCRDRMRPGPFSFADTGPRARHPRRRRLRRRAVRGRARDPAPRRRRRTRSDRRLPASRWAPPPPPCASHPIPPSSRASPLPCASRSSRTSPPTASVWRRPAGSSRPGLRFGRLRADDDEERLVVCQLGADPVRVVQLAVVEERSDIRSGTARRSRRCRTRR